MTAKASFMLKQHHQLIVISSCHFSFSAKLRRQTDWKSQFSLCTQTYPSIQSEPCLTLTVLCSWYTRTHDGHVVCVIISTEPGYTASLLRMLVWWHLTWLALTGFMLWLGFEPLTYFSKDDNVTVLLYIYIYIYIYRYIINTSIYLYLSV